MAALSVEHLKVMAALTVEPAYAFNLLIGWGGLDGGLISRAPKGDGGLNSRACLRIQFTSFFFDLFEGQISN